MTLNEWGRMVWAGPFSLNNGASGGLLRRLQSTFPFPHDFVPLYVFSQQVVSAKFKFFEGKKNYFSQSTFS